MRTDTTQELDKLNHYQAVCLQAINEFAETHPQDLVEFEKEKIVALLNRMFSGEKDYLLQSPDACFVIDENL